jgi:hypothetical protein
MRLPCPVVALEAPWVLADGGGRPGDKSERSSSSNPMIAGKNTGIETP